jgi:hypothetical protein
VAEEEVVPATVDEGGVGLERVVHPHAAAVGPTQQRQGLLVEVDRHHQRFAGMPEQGERRAGQAAGEDPSSACRRVPGDILFVDCLSGK